MATLGHAIKEAFITLGWDASKKRQPNSNKPISPRLSDSAIMNPYIDGQRASRNHQLANAAQKVFEALTQHRSSTS